VTTRLGARSRLTAVYTALFAAGGAVLVTLTYLLVAHALPASPSAPQSATRQAILSCLQAARSGGADAGDAKRTCTALYANGVHAGATAERATTLAHLLTYSLIGLAGVTLLAGAAAWITAGRVLRPVHRITAAARKASEHNLSQRISLGGPRDELRELADTFDEMLDRLDRAFTSQRHFIANASHELRTPLTVMRTAVDVVLGKPQPTSADLRSMSAEVRAAVNHAEGLIEALLVLARNEQQRRLTETADLAAITEEILEDRGAVGLDVITNLASAPVTGDVVLLERLVANLIDNAERYNVPHGSITISTETDEADAVLRISNSGQLVPAADVNRLFEPFTRLDDRTRHDGYGLGLTLAASIATAHGGTITAAARSAGGLDITVRLPARS
jgi:signal transduction histidine kinase